MKLLLAIALLTVFHSNSTLPTRLFDLQGKWKNVRGTTTIFEQWAKESDTKLSGTTWGEVEGKRQKETAIDISTDKKDVWMSSPMKSKTTQKPIKLKLSEKTDKTFTFTASGDDLLKKVKLTFVTKDSFKTTIIGMSTEKKEFSFDYGYSRVK